MVPKWGQWNENISLFVAENRHQEYEVLQRLPGVWGVQGRGGGGMVFFIPMPMAGRHRASGEFQACTVKILTFCGILLALGALNFIYTKFLRQHPK